MAPIMEKYKFPKDPVANLASVVAGATFRFTIISDTVLRYEWSEDGIFEDRASTFALNRRFPKPEYTVTDTPENLEIRTSSYQVTYNKKRFDRWGLVVSFIGNKNTLWGADWRYGEEPQNLGGTARTLDEVNGRCELEPGILSRAGYSVLDDSDTMLFTDDGWIAPRRGGDRIDGYLFSYGFDYRRAMKSFFAISGHQPLLPRYSLGNWWSRYKDYTDKEYLDLMDKFEEAKIPLSCAVIDMDWHIVHGDNVPHAGWTGYTWEKKYFPDPQGFTKELHKRKLRITLNDHPHAGIHHHEKLYEAVAKDLHHDTSANAPILFNPTSPEFMYSYLNTLHRSLEEDGCDFWWIDWQQGPYSAIKGLDPLWMLNHFHFVDNQLQQNGGDKALIFSRFGGPGSHRYPVGFSGDSIMTWESLAFQPEFTATASNIGFGWWSNDIGGHMGGYRDDELAARWVQLGVFSPIMRLHSSNSRWASKEPWLYRDEFAESMYTFLRLRHEMLPYLYTANVASAFEDEPIMQPLYWRFPERDEAYNKPNQYYFGPSLVVAPIVQPRDKSTHLAAVDVWVPPGRHIDIFEGLVYDGDREIRMFRNIHGLPILAPEGAIIPLDLKNRQDQSNGCENATGYYVPVVVGKDGKFTIEEDEWDDELPEGASPESRRSGSRKLDLKWEQAGGRLTINTTKKDWTILFVGVATLPETITVTVNGVKRELDTEPSIKKSQADLAGLEVPLPALEDGNAFEVVLEIGADPQLTPVDPTSRIEALLLDAQMDMGLKDKIWEAVTKSGSPVGVKVAQLNSLGLDESLFGPIVEYVSADSRF